jgi:hypothetical protein
MLGKILCFFLFLFIVETKKFVYSALFHVVACTTSVGSHSYSIWYCLAVPRAEPVLVLFNIVYGTRLLPAYFPREFTDPHISGAFSPGTAFFVSPHSFACRLLVFFRLTKIG